VLQNCGALALARGHPQPMAAREAALEGEAGLAEGRGMELLVGGMDEAQRRTYSACVKMMLEDNKSHQLRIEGMLEALLDGGAGGQGEEEREEEWKAVVTACKLARTANLRSIKEIVDSLSPIQQAKALISAVEGTHAQGGDVMEACATIGLAEHFSIVPSLGAIWLPGVGGQGPGQSMYEWWLAKIAKELGLNAMQMMHVKTQREAHLKVHKESLDTVMNHVSELKEMISEEGVGELVGPIRGRVEEQGRNEYAMLEEVNGMLDIDQKCASLALACGRSSPPCPALRGPGAAEQGSSALKESIRELFVPCEGLQLSEEQMTQLAMHFQTVRVVYMAGWTKVQASVRNISDSFLSGVSEEQLLQHWDELQAVLEGLDLALQKGRSQMMAVCTTWQRARILLSLVGQHPDQEVLHVCCTWLLGPEMVLENVMPTIWDAAPRGGSPEAWRATWAEELRFEAHKAELLAGMMAQEQATQSQAKQEAAEMLASLSWLGP